MNTDLVGIPALESERRGQQLGQSLSWQVILHAGLQKFDALRSRITTRDKKRPQINSGLEPLVMVGIPRLVR